MKPTTSFLLPAYNAERTLPDAIRSACAQTVQDFEVVIVDDGSEDDTLEVARAFNDPRVRVLARPHAGLVGALNAGLSACKGKYIARLDADDTATPDRLERQLPYLEADPSIGVIDGQVQFHRPFGPMPAGMQRYATWVNSLNSSADIHKQLLVESPLVHPAATLRADALRQLGGYRDGPFPEDYDLWLRLRRAGWRLGRVPKVLVHMRDHDARLTRTDARYARAAFRMLKQNWLASGPLQRPTSVAVWGAGRSGRPWIRWLKEQGHDVPFVVDIAHGGTRRGSPVVPPSALRLRPVERCLVAVGAAGARAIIRQAIGRLQPRWREGTNWWAVC